MRESMMMEVFAIALMALMLIAFWRLVLLVITVAGLTLFGVGAYEVWSAFRS